MKYIYNCIPTYLRNGIVQAKYKKILLENLLMSYVYLQMEITSL